MAAIFDAAVIGGGVVGCATLRRLAVGGLRTVLLEKSADILSGASKGNSGILHTGFDAPAGSLELRLMQSGYREYLRIAPRLNLPMLETGAVVVAWTKAEMQRLGAVEELARANGVATSPRCPARRSWNGSRICPRGSEADCWCRAST